MSLNNVLPHSTAKTRVYGAKPLPMLDPNDALITGPFVSYRNPSAISSGLLAGWDADAARAFLSFSKPVDCWDVSWGEEDKYFVDMVHSCSTPEEVEELLPVKWVGYRLASAGGTGAVDETLSRVCKLCTALVDKFTFLAQDDNRDQSAAKWRLHQTLLIRLKAVMTLLESSIGEAIPILKLKDPEFVRSCWQRLGDNDRHDVFSTLSSEASGTPTTGRGAFPPTTEEGGDADHAIFGDENEEAANHFRGGGGATATAPGMKAQRRTDTQISFAPSENNSSRRNSRSASVISMEGGAATTTTTTTSSGRSFGNASAKNTNKKTVVQRRY